MSHPFGAANTTPAGAALLHAQYGKPLPERIKAGVGSSTDAASFVTAGLPLVLIVANRNLAAEASTVPTDYNAYKASIVSIITHYGANKIALLLIEDAFLTAGNFSGGPTDIAAMVQAARDAAEPYGVKVASGGISHTYIAYGTYQDLVDRGFTAQADDFWTRAATAGMLKANAPANAAILETALDALKTTDADYIGAKFAGPSHGWTEAAAYLTAYTGKTAMLVDYGQLDTSTTTTDLLFNDAKSAGTPIVILQAGGSGSEQALVTGAPALTAIGTEWVALIILNYEQTGVAAACLLGIHATPRGDDEDAIIANGGIPFSASRFGSMGLPDVPSSAPWGPFSRDEVMMLSATAPPTYLANYAPLGHSAELQGGGIKIFLTVRHSTSTGVADVPVADDAAYIAAFGRLLDQLRPYGVVLGNEISRPDQWAGTDAQWAHLVALAAEECRKRNVICGTAGELALAAAQATYYYILATSGSTAATDFRGRVFLGTPDPVVAAHVEAHIDAAKAAGADYVWHSYFADAPGFLQIKDYLDLRMGRPTWSNELGWRTGLAATGEGIIDAVMSRDMPYVLFYGSGVGTNNPDKLWTKATGVPTAEGLEIIDYVAGLGDADAAAKNAIKRIELEMLPPRTLGTDRVYRSLGESWPDAYIDWTIAQGRRVVLSVDSRLAGGGIIPFADIAAGTYDAELDALAAGVGALADDIYFGFTQEPDAKYAAPGETLLQTQASYRAAWAHVHARFVAASVTNVIWTVMLKGGDFKTAGGGTPADQWYPGNSVTDVVGGDTYNPFQSTSTNWLELADAAGSLVTWCRAHSHARMLIAETGCLEDTTSPDPSRKAIWIKNGRQWLKDSAPEVEAVSWYTGGPKGWWIESPPQGSPQALAEWSAMGADSYFGGTGGAGLTREVAALIISPSQVAGGEEALGTLFLDGPAFGGGSDVTLSSDEAEVGVPASVHVSEGATSVDFIITTKAVAVEVAATVTATLGESSAAATLLVGSPLPPPGGTEPNRFEYVYNGLRIGGDRTSFNIENVDGLGDFVMREEVSPKGARHGSFTFARYLSERRVVFEGNVFGPTAAARAHRLQQLATAFTPDDVERELKFQYTDGVIKLIRAKTTRREVPINKSAAGDGTPFMIELLASDPLIYEEPSRRIELDPANVGISGVLMPVRMPALFGRGAAAFGEVFNVGTIGAPIVVTFVGPATNPQLTNLETGELVKIDIVLATAEQLVVDFSAETVRIGDVSRYIDLDPASTFFALGPGTTRLQFLADTTGPETKAIVQWSSTWAAAI